MSLAISPSKVVSVLTATAAEAEKTLHVESEGIVVWAEPSNGTYSLKVENRPSSIFDWTEVFFERVEGDRMFFSYFTFPQVRITISPLTSTQQICVAVKQASAAEIQLRTNGTKRIYASDFKSLETELSRHKEVLDDIAASLRVVIDEEECDK